METIIDAVDIKLVKAELTPDKKLCDTNKAGNEIYVFDSFNAPNLMREVGRLREISFRAEGSSSGLSMDIDEFDTMEQPYKQIIVWDPDAEAIIGGYRYILGPDVRIEDGQPVLATSHMFRFSERFVNEYLPHTMELGRSFVTPDYQSSKAGAKALFALDNLWDGITAVVMSHPNIMYLFGKMTMYPKYDQSARDLILHFLWKHFRDGELLVEPYEPVLPQVDGKLLDVILRADGFDADYKLLKDAVHRLGTSIPPLVNSYMKTSPTMKMMGTAVNHEFSEAEETAILVCFNEMYAEKRDRHKMAFHGALRQKMHKRFPHLGQEFVPKVLNRIEQKRENAFRRFKNRNRTSK